MSNSRQKKRPAKSKPATSKPESSTPVAKESSAELDDSGEGGPFIPTNRNGLSAESIALSDDELIVEVELVPTASHLARTIVSDTSKSFESLGSTAERFAGVLREYGMAQARSVFTQEHMQSEEARTKKLLDDVALGAAPLDRLESIRRLPPLSGFIRLRFPAGTRESEVIESLNGLPEVTRAVRVPRAAPPSVPGDPFIGTDGSDPSPPPGSVFQRQWYLHRTRVPQAWPFSRGADVVIADIDWGFRTGHQEFEGAIELTYNAVDGSDDVTHGDDVGHGTAVLGLAGARASADGIAGYAPEAKFWAIQGDSSVNPATFEEPWVEAINFVRRTDAGTRRKVIILEVETGAGGNYEQVPSVNREIRAAIADGCVVCVAAGNGTRRVDLTDAGPPSSPPNRLSLVQQPSTPLRTNVRRSATLVTEWWYQRLAT